MMNKVTAAQAVVELLQKILPRLDNDFRIIQQQKKSSELEERHGGGQL